ncbi:SseB family protein [Micromonospora sp. C28ISP2-4]|uniref:SseB family protein n=1 Tax=Micromonospora sp. C28ISP2-4 TaxID=3059523 RepID=UPI002676F54B|nr:SseB family protein [Micromonospora sp. C28ISP2-4]MDO3683500.1 SseB family protein [Micromonospora sp. C28ISP2-4]
MTGWEPATEAEVAMRDALRAQDQQQYFRVLTRVDLLLPVASGPTAGWGTWTSGGRTHVLAFTSIAALRASLGEKAGPTRRVPYPDLAAGWPNPEWWLAVNPGLPIEGYLPAWYVAQLSRGDVRLPGRTMGARARLERVENATRGARNTVPEAAPRPPAVPVPAATVTPAPVPPAAVPPAAVPPPVVPPPAVPPPAVPPPVVPPVVGAPARDERLKKTDEPPTVPMRAASVLGRRLPTVPPRRRASDSDAPSRTAPGDESDTDALDGWLTDLRRRPDEPDPFAAAPAAPADEPPAAPVPPPSRSFFEPSSGGRSARRPSPLDPSRRAGDRATPPTRFAGGQQFPRRRPLNEPVREGPTHAFASRPHEPSPVPRSDEATQAFRPTRPPEDATEALPRRQAGPANAADAGSATAAGPAPAAAWGATPGSTEGGTSRWETIDEPVEELPPSIAEPVSAPPAARRDFTPIVIEGTVIEARDLTEPAPLRPAQQTGPVDADEGAATPWAGADPTMPLSVDPPVADDTVNLAEPTPSHTRAAGATDRSTPRDEPAVPLASSSEPTTSLFESPAPAGEATAPLFTSSASAEPAASLFDRVSTEPTGSLSGPAEAEPTVSLFDPAPAEPTVSLFDPAPAEPTVSLFDPAPAEPTVSLFDPAPAEPTVSLFDPAPAEPTVSLFDPVPPESTTSLSNSAPDDPTAPLTGPAPSEPAAPLPDAEPVEQPTVSLFAPATGDEPVTTSLFAPGEPTVALSAPAPETATPATTAGPQAGRGSTTASATAEFVPANDVEEDLLAAAGSGSTDGFLTTLLLARVLLPVAPDSAAGSRPGDSGFVWHADQVDGERCVSVYTSPERLAEHTEGQVETVRVKFVQLIRRWPDVTWSFRVNPGSPVGATYPGEQVLALANWAAEVGLGDDPEPAAAPQPAERQRPETPTIAANRPVTMQKAIAASQLAYYLERGYDRVSGFVHRAGELAHLRTPAELFRALGLGHPGSPFSPDDEEIYLLRWPAYRPSLYRIPYGGPNEAAMRAMEGWVIERPPFRGNGFAPGESSDVIAEFKVDSARLPHGAELWRVGADGDSKLVAVLDTDELLWRKAGEA